MARPLRIFISSPGDVVPERRRVALLIEKLGKHYARFFAIELILWEVEPMLASGHFQDNITPPSLTDIFVLIVWSRLGTALPSETLTRAYCGIDGRVPVTGTEWEFEDALAAQRAHGAPDLLAYRKQADPTVSLRDMAAKAAAEQQWDKLNGFWDRWFVNQGEFRAAFREFIHLDEFEEKAESDLRRLIERRIQALADQNQSVTGRTWHTGSPFRGLDTYHFEHAPIFFGRNILTKTAVEQLTGHPEDGRAFLLILGASGAGKSSLAQAGVLPALVGRGIVPGVGLWRRAVMRVGNPEGPFIALAEALTAKDALPELLTSGQDIASFGRHLKASVDDPAYSIVAALEAIEAAARSRDELLLAEAARLVIVVDQLEELFTAGEITAHDRIAFIRCLDGLAKSAPVLVIGTMRSDYWHRAAETPLLVEMAAGSRRLDLLPPTQDEIIEMIRQPAAAAGLEFENDPGKIKLDATLAKEAATEPGALPLLSFLLDELYKIDVESTGKSTLTYASMRNLGGLKQAIATQAEAIHESWPIEVREALPRVLRALVTVSRLDAAPTARSAPMSRFPEGTPTRKIINALLDQKARLLVAEGDGDGARVRFAHEALITHWKTARDQIARDQADLELRGRLEQGAALWRSSDDGSRLLGEGTPILEAEQLLARYPDELSEDVTTFIQASRLKSAGRPQTAVVVVERDLRLDLFMGLALWLMFLGSFRSNFVNWISLGKFGFSDATEIFIFISGYTMASAYYPVIRDHGLRAALQLILAVAGRAYLTYVFMFALYLTAISYLALRFGDTALINETRTEVFMNNPLEALRQALFLKSQPANMEVLPLYISLLPLFPLFLWLLYRRPMLALAASVCVYILDRYYNWNFAAYPGGQWSLNPFAWQLLFGFGAWCGFGGAGRIGGFLRSRTTPVLAVACLVFAGGMTRDLIWDLPRLDVLPHWLTNLIDPADRTNLSVPRIAHFLALAVLAARLIPHNWAGLKNYLFRPAILCGQHPLGILCLVIFLSFVVSFQLALAARDLWIEVFLSSICIVIMVAASALQPSDSTQHVSIIQLKKSTPARE